MVAIAMDADGDDKAGEASLDADEEERGDGTGESLAEVSIARRCARISGVGCPAAQRGLNLVPVLAHLSPDSSM